MIKEKKFMDPEAIIIELPDIDTLGDSGEEEEIGTGNAGDM